MTIAYDHDPEDQPEWGGTYRPVIICDACGKPIVRSGNVYWLVHDDGSVDPRVWHTHKFPCARLDDAIRQAHGGLVMFEELDRWLAQLGHNFVATETA